MRPDDHVGFHVKRSRRYSISTTTGTARRQFQPPTQHFTTDVCGGSGGPLRALFHDVKIVQNMNTLTTKLLYCKIPGFRRDVNEVVALLLCCLCRICC
jgi:hypothetical protein